MQTQLKIEGMSCNHCVLSVREALESVPGVEKASVDLAAGTAVVEHNDAVSQEQLTTAVAEEGYRASGA
jgi:copper chaperone